jgi:hypothetical protein
VVSLPERFHASPVDGRIYESSRVTSEARPASYLQKTGLFYIAAGAHRFSQRSFLAEDGRSRFVVSHPSITPTTKTCPWGPRYRNVREEWGTLHHRRCNSRAWVSPFFATVKWLCC